MFTDDNQVNTWAEWAVTGAVAFLWLVIIAWVVWMLVE